MHVAAIWQYPVKSMIGGQVESAEISATRMIGDRAWALRDEVRGGIRGAKKIGELMQFAARFTGPVDGPSDGAVEITLPDGSTVGSGDADVNARLSKALDHEVTLWPLQPATDLDHYRRGPSDNPDDMMAELRQVFGRTDDEPLPDLSIFPPEILDFESTPGTYLDAYPLLIMTTSALRSLRRAVPEANPDVRRFRPNLLVDTADEPGHPEFEWSGKRLRVGEVELEIGAGCPRCVMVTREIDATLPQDRTILRHIVRDLGQNVGVYATAVAPGIVRAGDVVEQI